jgi:hypothetical protein
MSAKKSTRSRSDALVGPVWASTVLAMDGAGHPLTYRQLAMTWIRTG